MRDYTTLPHTKEFVGKLWNSQTQKGNYDDWGRAPIDTIVIHSMAGYMQGTKSWFMSHNQSAHYGVSMKGDIVSYIPENCVAYHAGMYSMNQRSIGIECEDFGNNTTIRTEELYKSVALIVADIAREYAIPLDLEHIKIHKEVVPTSCPGTLDRAKIIAMAKESLNPEATHNYTMTPSVFTSMVTKSSEYDALWTALGFEDVDKKKVGSHMIILQKIDFITKEIDLLKNSQKEETLKEEAKPLHEKDIKRIFAEFLAFMRLKKL